jgi:hypothetical protein
VVRFGLPLKGADTEVRYILSSGNTSPGCWLGRLNRKPARIRWHSKRTTNLTRTYPRPVFRALVRIAELGIRAAGFLADPFIHTSGSRRVEHSPKPYGVAVLSTHVFVNCGIIASIYKISGVTEVKITLNNLIVCRGDDADRESNNRNDHGGSEAKEQEADFGPQSINVAYGHFNFCRHCFHGYKNLRTDNTQCFA